MADFCRPFERDPKLKRWERDLQLGSLEDEILEMMGTIRTMVCFLLGYNSGSHTKDLAMQVLEYMRMRLGSDHRDTLLVLKHLAELLVCGVPWILGGGGLPPQGLSIVREHVAAIERGLDRCHSNSLRFLYAAGREFLGLRESQEAKDIFLRVFERESSRLNAENVNLKNVIGRLLESFCQKLTGHDYPIGGGIEKKSLLNDLIRFCLGEEEYAGLEALIEGWLIPAGGLKETSAMSSDVEFVEWYYALYEKELIQGTIASYRTPDEHFYWEDSRMYLRRWANVTFVTASPEDPFPLSLAASMMVPSSARQLDKLEYSIVENRYRGIDLTIPFVPYEHFQKSQAFRYGFTYVDYLGLREDSRAMKRIERWDGPQGITFTGIGNAPTLPSWYLCSGVHSSNAESSSVCVPNI
ncbi:hypothetical protein LTR66_014019 [Elasticomyces elasticus]|nr:hypothetical protein LTR66_014019 [Elasticomyces elasticus]